MAKIEAWKVRTFPETFQIKIFRDERASGISNRMQICAEVAALAAHAGNANEALIFNMTPIVPTWNISPQRGFFSSFSFYNVTSVMADQASQRYSHSTRMVPGVGGKKALLLLALSVMEIRVCSTHNSSWTVRVWRGKKLIAQLVQDVQMRHGERRLEICSCNFQDWSKTETAMVSQIWKASLTVR